MKINKLNYEAYAIDYIEGNLSEKGLQSMESFLNDHPQIRMEIEEMAKYELPKFKNILLIDKSSLLQKEPKRLWPLLSIAATLLLLVGCSLFIFLSGQKDNSTIDLATNTVEPLLNNKSDNAKIIENIEQNSNQVPKKIDSENEIKSDAFKSVAEVGNEKSNKGVSDRPVVKNLNKTSKREIANITVDKKVKAKVNNVAPNNLLDAEKLDEEAREVVAIAEPIKKLRPIRIIDDLRSVKLPAAGIKSSKENTDLVDEVGLLLNTEPMVAQVNKKQKLRNLSDYIQPESYDKGQLGSLKEALVPEGFANLFSKKSAKTR